MALSAMLVLVELVDATSVVDGILRFCLSIINLFPCIFMMLVNVTFHVLFRYMFCKELCKFLL